MSSQFHRLMTSKNFANLKICVGAIHDPRVKQRTRYPLTHIIIMALCATLGGANDFVAIERFCIDHKGFFMGLLGPKVKVPSHDTFGRVFSLISPRTLFKWVSLWLNSVAKSEGCGNSIALDGKVIASLSHKDPFNFVRAWSSSRSLVIGQEKVKHGSNEIVAMQEVLKELSLEGKVVTIDAIGTQKKIAKLICQRGGDYVLALKRNHRQLYENVKSYLEGIAGRETSDGSAQYYKHVDKSHGRHEVRECWIADSIGWLLDRENWHKLMSIALVRSTVKRGEKTTYHQRFFISSLTTTAQEMLSYVRGHWNIENQLHWQLDVAFREDASTLKDVYAVQNLASLRATAVSLLLQKESNLSVKNKRARASANRTFLMEVLLNT